MIFVLYCQTCGLTRAVLDDSQQNQKCRMCEGTEFSRRRPSLNTNLTAKDRIFLKVNRILAEDE